MTRRNPWWWSCAPTDYDPPIDIHVNEGHGRGAFLTLYPHPVRACSGRQAMQTQGERVP